MILDVATKYIFECRLPGQWGLHSRYSLRGKAVGGPVSSKVATISRTRHPPPVPSGVRGPGLDESHRFDPSSKPNSPVAGPPIGWGIDTRSRGRLAPPGICSMSLVEASG